MPSVSISDEAQLSSGGGGGYVADMMALWISFLAFLLTRSSNRMQKHVCTCVQCKPLQPGGVLSWIPWL